ncbi:hypothetical protein [Zymomonas mobilis]|uniref:hypothetical protein n=1 Tax=Zymomonas mobilis TaxID=542 RepID=UPI0039ED7D5A
MKYEQIEIILTNEHPRIWKDLLSLHHTYKNQITEKTAENCACHDVHEVAAQVAGWVMSCPEDVRDSFSLMSMTYDEIKEQQRITGQKLTRKSNRLRRNLRRILNIRPEDDQFQIQFDKDKIDSEKSYIVRYDSKSDNTGWTAYDAKQKNLRKRYAVNRSIAEHIDDSSVNFLNYEGLFLSLTLPSEYHGCSYETAKNEIARRWTNIHKRLKYRNILNLGMSIIELQRDETPHYHVQLYVAREHRELLESVIIEQFPNEHDRRNDAVKDIWDALGCIGYCLKDSTKTETYISFIGLTRDIKSRYDNVYNGKCHKDLSDWRISKARRMMFENKPAGAVLLMLRGFSDERLNSLSARHPAFYHVQTDIQKLQITYIHCIHFCAFNHFNNKSKEQKNNSCHRIKKMAVFSRFYTFLRSLVYVYQESNTFVFYSWECEKSRGQPPPRNEKKGLISHSKQTISDISADWHKNHGYQAIGAESHENQ